MQEPAGTVAKVQLQVHALEEMDTPAFWKFVDDAITGFQKFTDRVQQRPEDLMPWKILGRRLALAQKDFRRAKKSTGKPRCSRSFAKCLRQRRLAANSCGTINRSCTCWWPASAEPWGIVFTKRLSSVDLVLNGPKDRFALGRIAKLAAEREFDGSRANIDAIKLKFCNLTDLAAGDLAGFLTEHAASVSTGTSPKWRAAASAIG